ncbi:MAG: hypothetical protein JOZ25_09665, partial [Actinobacteria bacterium]|nr:hypothetical protein [Actinomycetota bacterium]
MPAPPLASFWSAHRDLITAAVTVVLAFALAHLLDRTIARREGAFTARVGAGDSQV